MTVVRIWAVESDHDKDAIEKLAQKILKFFDRKEIVLRASGKKTYAAVASQGKKKGKNGLEIAVKSYFQNGENKIVFVLDADNPHALRQKEEESNSLIAQIKQLSSKFPDEVYLAIAVWELEAWLLTDCTGIFCYFAKSRYKGNCREKVKEKKQHEIRALLNRYQKGDTERIVESESGGTGPKERLIEFSENILKALDSEKSDKAIKSGRYREALAPKVAEYIEISHETLKRNRSFEKFANLLKNQKGHL